MNLKHSIFTLLTIITVTSALPAQKGPIAYNLHQNLSPRDVNELTRDQRAKAALDVQATIDEVQKLLALDPTLPRLTKGEIKDLFEKATRDELEKSILSGDEAKQKHMKYLIQALPFHSDDVETLEQLARRTATTKAPSSQPEIPEDLKKLLKSYGLMDDSGKAVDIAPLPLSSLLVYEDDDDKSLTPEEVKKSTFVMAKDYEAFKPIEASKKNVSSDMASYLKQFGLAGDDSKKRKSPSSSKLSANATVASIDSAYLTPNFKSLLDNIGISTTKDKRGKKTNTRTTATKSSSKSADDYEKLEHLLETIKELEKLNSTLTEKDIERLSLSNFNFSQSLLTDGPDPIKYQTKFSALKNEVKRQNPSEPTRVSLGLTGPLLESSLEATDDAKTESVETPTEEPETETTIKASTTTTTTEAAPAQEEEKKNSLEDEIEPIDDPDPLPPPRRSGFYMLFDWNSFLEVGEDPDKTVIRFDPKIGDPSRFLPVSVP